jgi:hypothetical protein
MSRSTTTIVIALLALLVQWVAVARWEPLMCALSDVQHLQMHFQHDGHHHAEDGSLQSDSSEDAAQHIHADCCVHAPILISAALRLGAPPRSAAVFLFDDELGPSPPLDALFKPPKFPA